MNFIINHSGRDKRDVRRAERLTAALSRKSRLMKAPSQQSWIMEFKQLRESGAKVAPVLNWYCKHIGEKGVPDVRSASGFRKRFRDLEKAMQRTRGDSDGVRIRKDVRQFIDEYLSYDRWPGDSFTRLPAAVQASSDNHAIMVDRLDSHLNTWGVGPERDWPETAILAADILADHQETFTFVLNWFNWVNKRVTHWSDWNGSFGQFIFRADHKRFSSQMFEKSAYITGDPRAWEILLKEIS